MFMRAEHNCHLCKKEWLGRCMGKHYGKDVSIDDTPVCDEYEYGGSQEQLKAIQKNQKKEIGMKTEVNIEELIAKFEDMANRGTLLIGSKVTQEDLLMQIIGTIVKVANE